MCGLEWQRVNELVALPVNAGEGEKGNPASRRVFD